MTRTALGMLISAVLLAVLPTTSRADLDLPVNGPVTSGVGWRVDPFGSGRLVYHKGIDIAVPEGRQSAPPAGDASFMPVSTAVMA